VHLTNNNSWVFGSRAEW